MVSDRDIERSKTMMTEMARKSVKGGRKDLRSVGDMNPFFSSGMIQQLVALESSLEKQFDLPVTALCAYTRDNAEKKKKKKKKRMLIYSYANYHPFTVFICPYTYSFQSTLPFCIYLVGARFCKGVKVCLGHRVAPIYALCGLCEIDFI
jgi:hypothetical protein